MILVDLLIAYYQCYCWLQYLRLQ